MGDEVCIYFCFLCVCFEKAELWEVVERGNGL